MNYFILIITIMIAMITFVCLWPKDSIKRTNRIRRGRKNVLKRKQGAE